MQNASEELITFLLINIIVVASIATLTLSLIFIHRRKQRISKNRLEKIRSDYEKEVLKTKLEIQEQTSHNIAREIHDSIGHGLTLAKLQLNTLVSQQEEAESNKVLMAIDLLGHAIHQLSNISKNLNAEALLQQGLLPGLDEEISRLRSLGRFEVQYEVNGFTSYMEPQREIVVYRIIQEGFQNIIKHADAKRAQLLLHFHPDYIHVSLNDNGKGFDRQTPASRRSTGLINMENRVRFLNGKFDIQSQPGRGTQIKFTIPYTSHVNPK